MRLSSTLTTLLTGFLTLASALPAPEPAQLEERSVQCTNPLVRKEWRTLNFLQKANYLFAVKCLMHTPGKLQSQATGIKTRWEDLVWTHQHVMAKVHYVGQFLPWHRLFLYEYERIMREECYYFGALPYWDQSLDYEDLTQSPMFNGLASFGGNGAWDPNATLITAPSFPSFPSASGGGCITDGPFADEIIHLGHMGDDTYHERCIKRNILKEPAREWQTPARHAAVLTHTTYEEFAVALEGNIDWYSDFGIHNSGHMGVQGDMMDMWTSPLDPVFYVFHGNIDRLWWKWQMADPANRLFAVGNPIAPRLAMTAPLWPDAPAGNVTLDFALDLGPLAGSRLQIQTAQILDPRGSTPDGRPAGVACYTYDN